jgi:hypothetical protein
MAVSTVPTLKFLNAWARVMLEDTWRFNQVQGNGVPRNTQADAFIQPDRDEVARALNDAVYRIIDYLEYFPRPTYITDEIIPLGWGSPYQFQTLETRYKHLIEFGSRATTLIDDDVSVVYSANIAGKPIDKATITVTTDVDVSEIQVFFRTADGAPAAADELYEIEPLKVTRTNATTVEITGHRALFVRPDTIWDVPYTFDDGNLTQRHYADIEQSADFVTKVDVYRVYTTTTSAVQLVSDGYLYDCGSPSTNTYTAAGARIVNPRLGIFQVRASDCGCGKPFESVKANYKAGLALVRGQVDTVLEEAIVRFANTFFGQKPTDMTNRVNEKWTYDRDFMEQNGLQPGDAKNPFGIQRGAIFAWRTIMNPRFMIGKGGKLTARG